MSLALPDRVGPIKLTAARLIACEMAYGKILLVGRSCRVIIALAILMARAELPL